VSGVGPQPLADYLAARRARIEAELERYLPQPPACPASINEAMRYSLFAGGKRLRPILTLAAAEAVASRLGSSENVAADLALPAACALEMIHTYSLIHDDLPAMDDDSLRRGRPTSHVVFGEGMAILAGDGLLTEALALMAREPSAVPLASGMPESELVTRKLHALVVVAGAAGAAGMVGGQALDLQATGQAGAPVPVDLAGLRAIHERKTGALIRAAATAGAIMAGAGDELVQAIDAFAADLGLAFQIIDDVLDVEGAPSDLGKTAGKDAAAGKPTYPALYGLGESKRLAAGCIESADETLAAAGLGGRLPDIARWVIGRTW
jgi:geranylgeranyl diphosphate synthase type II